MLKTMRDHFDKWKSNFNYVHMAIICGILSVVLAMIVLLKLFRG